MGIYDPTGGVGRTLASKKYFEELQELAGERESKAASRKLGISSAQGLKKASEFFSPAKLTVDSKDFGIAKSIFKDTPPTVGKLDLTGTKNIFEKIGKTGENIFEKIGQRLGPDLNTAELTQEAIDAGYEISKGRYNVLGQIEKPSVLSKTSMVTDKAGKLVPKTEEVSKQFGKAGSKVGSLLGAYQVGSGLSTAFDPKASGTRKVAGVANAALGANALLAMAGANLWNPMGPMALFAGGVASLADMFG